MRFLPSEHGFDFVNCFDSGPIFWGLGDASLGLCGGMSFAALDYFLAKRKPPEFGDGLLAFLKARQVASVAPLGWARFYARTVQSDGGLYRLSLAELAKLRRVLGERPAPLALVKVRSFNPLAMSKNHQVLACGVEDYNGVPFVQIYDPNYPGDDQRYIAVGENGLSYGGAPLRGFFLSNYKKADPPA